MPDYNSSPDYSKELQDFIVEQKRKAFVKVSPQKARILQKVPLYYKTSDTEWEIYKPADMTISDMRVEEDRLPRLYVLARDRQDAAIETQKKLNERLREDLEKGDLKLIRDSMVSVTDELLQEPRSGTYKEASRSIAIVLKSFSRKDDILSQMASITSTDYTTAVHSVNVMALMLGFCKFVGFNWQKTIQFSMAALLHDVGKTHIPVEILTSPNKLSAEEFRIMKSHPTFGAEILIHNGIRDDKVLCAAAEHHEKVNGNGYPKRIKDVSLVAQLVSIMDIYEALTNNERPYRRAMPPCEALKILREENDKGSFVFGLVDRFILSLNDPRM